MHHDVRFLLRVKDPQLLGARGEDDRPGVVARSCVVPVVLPPEDFLVDTGTDLPPTHVPESLCGKLDCRRRARCADEDAGKVLAEDPFGHSGHVGSKSITFRSVAQVRDRGAVERGSRGGAGDRGETRGGSARGKPREERSVPDRAWVVTTVAA